MNKILEKNLDTSFFGHPGGLTTLFYTEMWERMSYYGMRVLLVLFMTASLQDEGLGITVASATAIYGLYTGFVYFMGLPGGWIADRLLGGQRAVWYGGLIIMCGHIVLAIPYEETFFVGLILVVIGTGLLKPNIGAMVGQLYKPKDERIDGGYAIYYLGINLGSFFGYLILGYVAAEVSWHWAFGGAAVGMAIGLIQYRLTTYKLKGVGSEPVSPLSPSGKKTSWLVIAGVAVAFSAFVISALRGYIELNPVTIAEYVAIAFLVLFLVYYASIYKFGNLTANEKKKLGALFLVCVASTCFWSGFEQAGSSLNLFARDYTDMMIGTFEIPTAWMQFSNSMFIVLLTPFFAALWINLGKRMINPSYGFKCALGLMIMGSGFIVMYFAAHFAASGLKVAPYWLIMTYFLHTVGELCLSPVALSAVSKLSPRRFSGQMMGVFVLTYSIGNIFAGLLAGKFDPNNVAEMPGLYAQISIFCVGVGIVLLLISMKSKVWEKVADESDDKVEAATAA